MIGVASREFSRRQATAVAHCVERSELRVRTGAWWRRRRSGEKRPQNRTTRVAPVRVIYYVVEAYLLSTRSVH